MSEPKSPLSRLDRKELLWLTGILKDACRERLEKNLVSQAFEERLHSRGPVAGRLDPRPFLKIWEPRYRKFLEVATELHALIEAEDAKALAITLHAQCDPENRISRRGPASAEGEYGRAGKPRRRPRSRAL